MNVLETWIDGNKVFGDGKTLFDYKPAPAVNKFNCSPVKPGDIMLAAKNAQVRVIKANEGELLTGEFTWEHRQNENLKSDISADILKIIVKDRYNDGAPAVAFIKGFGLKKGAFASSIAHDSHNIICVGTSDTDIINAVNRIIEIKGGLAVSEPGKTESLQLNIAGIMSTRTCDEIASDYEHLNDIVRSFGCPMKAPFMTLSFMALLVIPDLKISDRGLFDVRKFTFVPLFQ
jgi:adenine deaminase